MKTEVFLNVAVLPSRQAQLHQKDEPARPGNLQSQKRISGLPLLSVCLLLALFMLWRFEGLRVRQRSLNKKRPCYSVSCLRKTKKER